MDGLPMFADQSPPHWLSSENTIQKSADCITVTPVENIDKTVFDAFNPPTVKSEKRVNRRLFSAEEDMDKIHKSHGVVVRENSSPCTTSVSFMVASGTLDEKCSVFVGDLGSDIDEDMLFKSFSNFGSVVAVDLKRDRYTHDPLGYAFVYFSTEEEANMALSSANGITVSNRKIRTGKPQRNTTLHIPYIDPATAEDDLKSAFRSFGDIIEEDSYFVHRCYAYIRFRSRDEAENAKQRLDGTVFGKSKIKVEWANTELLRYAVQFHFDVEKSDVITFESVRLRMNRFGTITKIEIFSDSSGRKTGIGRVYFTPDKEGELAASKAIKFVKYIAGAKVWCTFLKEMVPREIVQPTASLASSPEMGLSSNMPEPFLSPILSTETTSRRWERTECPNQDPCSTIPGPIPAYVANVTPSSAVPYPFSFAYPMSVSTVPFYPYFSHVIPYWFPT
eukprot:jgi/Galph1/6013/GphlegSOOS_G4734.1